MAKVECKITGILFDDRLAQRADGFDLRFR